MIDHAPYFNALKRAEQENAEMAELEQRAAPLQWAVYLAVLLLSLGYAYDVAQAHIQHVDSMAATNEVFAQCLNGTPIGIGKSGVLHCEVREYQLIANGGVK